MKFTPRSEDDLARESLLPAGVYPFSVIDARDRVSSNGNEMIELKLEVFGNDGERVHVYDYLLEKMAFKLRHFAEAAGLIHSYERGELTAEMCVSAEGMLKIDIKEQPGYSPKNSVKDYVKVEQPASPAPSKPPANKRHAASMKAQTPAPAPAGEFDDDIPF